MDRLASGWETPKISNFPKSRGCRGLEEPLQEGKFPSRMIPGPRSGVFRVRQTLIGSIRTRRANIPNYLPESAATSPPLRPPGPDRLSAPARRSQNPLHAGEIRVGAPRCSPSAISAPKSSLRRGDLIRNCRRVWGVMVRAGGRMIQRGKTAWGTPNIRGLVSGTPKHPSIRGLVPGTPNTPNIRGLVTATPNIRGWVLDTPKHPEHLWVRARHPKYPKYP